MNKHDQALLDLYNLMVAQKAARLYLKLGGAMNGITDSMNVLSRAFPQVMLNWLKEQNQRAKSFEEAYANLAEKAIEAEKAYWEAMRKAFYAGRKEDG